MERLLREQQQGRARQRQQEHAAREATRAAAQGKSRAQIRETCVAELRARGTGVDSELSALAGIDHGPAMKDALLKSLTSGSFPHWAARALTARWEDDEEEGQVAPVFGG